MTKDEAVDAWLSTVLRWLVLTQDPRAVRTETGWRITDIIGASADFCRAMAANDALAHRALAETRCHE